MTWGHWTRKIYVFAPAPVIGIFLDGITVLLTGQAGETKLFDRWQYSTSGEQPYEYCGFNTSVHEDAYPNILSFLQNAALSGVLYYVIDCRTDRIVETTSSMYLPGTTCTWNEAVGDLGLATIAAPVAVGHLASLFDFESLESPITAGGDGGEAFWVSSSNPDDIRGIKRPSLLPTPRYIRFSSPMTINLFPNDLIAGGSLTLDGRDSAICIRGGTVGIYSDTVILNLRFLGGIVNNPQTDDALRVMGSHIHIINTLVGWGADSNIELDADDVLFQECIIAEGLDGIRTPGGGYQSKGVFGMSSTDKITFYRSLFHGRL